MNKTLYDYLRIFIDQKYILANDMIKINFISDRESMIVKCTGLKYNIPLEYDKSKCSDIDLLNLPVQKVQVLVKKHNSKPSLMPIHILEEFDTRKLKTIYTISPSLLKLNSLLITKDIIPYRSHKIYGVGDYCLYRNEIYTCVHETEPKGKFNENYWKKFNTELDSWQLVFNCLDLPKSLTDSFLYKIDVLNFSMFNTISTYSNTIISIEKIERAVEYVSEEFIKSNEIFTFTKALNFICREFEHSCGKEPMSLHIRKSDISDSSLSYYILEKACQK